MTATTSKGAEVNAGTAARGHGAAEGVPFRHGAEEAPDEAKGAGGTSPAPASAPRLRLLGVLPDLHEDIYHSDPTSVSASNMKQILRSPAHFQHSLKHPKKTNALDLGTITHRLVLGRGAEYAVLNPAEIGVLKDGKPAASPTSTAAWKEAVAAEEAKGLIVLTSDQFATAERMADAVLSHKKASIVLGTPGRSEVSMFWQDPTYDVIRRCRWDRLGDNGIGGDLKTSRTADPDALPKIIHDYRYEMSAAWYLAVAAGLGVDVDAYALVFVESSEPHNVVVVELSGAYLERGHALAEKALRTYRQCVDSGAWPGYLDDDFLVVDPPRWAMSYDELAIA